MILVDLHKYRARISSAFFHIRQCHVHTEVLHILQDKYNLSCFCYMCLHLNNYIHLFVKLCIVFRLNLVHNTGRQCILCL